MHISATEDRLLQGAELIGLHKLAKDNEMERFLVDDLENFENSENINDFLTQADRLKIINYELNNLKLNHDEVKFHNGISLYKYDGIVNQLLKQQVINSVFPVHDKDELKRLETIWYKNVDSYQLFNFIPIEQIKNYFGESVAFYFSFFEYYTKWLIPLALLGILTWILPVPSIIKFIIYCVCNLIWGTLFIETWKRKSSYQGYNWGILNNDIHDKQRVEFEGEPRISPITNKLELYSSK